MKKGPSDPDVHLGAPLDQKYLLRAEMHPAGHGVAFTKQMATEKVARH